MLDAGPLKQRICVGKSNQHLNTERDPHRVGDDQLRADKRQGVVLPLTRWMFNLETVLQRDN